MTARSASGIPSRASCRQSSPASYAGGAPNPAFWAAYISNSQILTLDYSGHLYVFTASGEQQAVINPGTAVNSAAWNRAGTEIVTADLDGMVNLWHAIGPKFTQIPLPSPIHLNGPGRVGMSPDGSRIAIVTPDHYTIQVRSTHTGQLLQTLNAAIAITAVAFSPSGRQILTGGANGQVEVWDAATGHLIRTLGRPGPYISDAEFNKSGSEFVTASASGVVTVWAARDDRRLRSIHACPSPSTASLSPDGSKIVVACGDGSAPVFDAATGRLLTVVPAASAGTVKLRRVQSGRQDHRHGHRRRGCRGHADLELRARDPFATGAQTARRTARHPQAHGG